MGKKNNRQRRSHPNKRAASNSHTRMRPWYRRTWLQVLGLLSLIVLAWRLDAAGSWSRGYVQSALQRHDPAAALEWLGTARKVSLAPAQDDLLEARVWLSLNQNALAQAALAKAERAGLAASVQTSYQSLIDLQRGYGQQAVRLLQGDPNLGPGELFEALARCALLNGQAESARSVADQWETEQSTDARPEYYRGRAMEVLEDYQAAAMHYAESVARCGTLAKARFRLSKMHQHLLDYQAALEPLEFRSTRYQALFDIERAECLYQLEDYEAAQAAIAVHLDTPPHKLNALCYELDEFQEWDRAKALAGRIALQLGRPQEAIELWQNALAFNHRDFATVYQLQQVLREQGQTAEADQWLEKHSEMLKKRQQIGVLRKQIADDPTDLESRLALAERYFEVESLAETQGELQAILGLDPDYAAAHALLARVYRERARYDESVGYLIERHEGLSK